MALSVADIKDLIFRQLGPTIRKANLMVARGVIRRVTDSARMQLVQLSLLGDPTEEGDEELPDNVEHFQPFGLSFVPPAMSEVVALSVGGSRSHVVALGASSRPHRPTGAEEGEGGLYTLDGWRVYLTADGQLLLGDGPEGTLVEVALAPKVEAVFTRIRDAVQSAATGTNDGGALFKSQILLALGIPDPGDPGADPGPAFPGSVGSSKVKAVE